MTQCVIIFVNINQKNSCTVEIVAEAAGLYRVLTVAAFPGHLLIFALRPGASLAINVSGLATTTTTDTTDTTDSERNQVKAVFEQMEMKLRRRSLCNIRFIGELYKLEVQSRPASSQYKKVDTSRLKTLTSRCRP